MTTHARIAALESALRAARREHGMLCAAVNRTSRSCVCGASEHNAAIDAALAGSGEEDVPAEEAQAIIDRWARATGIHPDMVPRAMYTRTPAADPEVARIGEALAEDMARRILGDMDAPEVDPLAVARAALDEAAHLADPDQSDPSDPYCCGPLARSIAKSIRAIDPAAIVAKVRG